MSADEEAKSAKPQNKAVDEGVAAGFDKDAIANLTGFFDVLIQMDLALKQSNERNSNVNNLQSNSKGGSKVD